MNRKLICFISSLLFCLISNAQEHISFNGSTFGKRRPEFISSMKCYPTDPKIIGHTEKNLYNRYHYSNVYLNSYKCQMFLHSSIKGDNVFETIVWFRVSEMQDELKYFLTIFEEKYGGHIKERQDQLGYGGDVSLSVNSGYDGYYGCTGPRYKEMLALKYFIKGSNGTPIGEIRISCIPDTNSGSTKYGWIEITYRDYAASESAIAEYKKVMNDIL